MKLLDKLRRVGQLAAIFSIITIGMAVSFTNTAAAADNVVDGAGPSAFRQFGTIKISANYDNTNCDPNSLNNCSGLNGALCDYYVFKQKNWEPGGRINDGESMNLYIDTHGDGGGWFSKYIVVTFNLEGTDSAGYRTLKASCTGAGGDVRRTMLDVFGLQTSYLNPYGLSHNP